LVHGAVVGLAEGPEVIGVVRSAFGPRFDVVHVRIDRVPAARDAAFSAVPAEDCTADSRRDGLAGTGANRVQVCTGVFGVDAHVGVDMPDALPVALGHLEDFGTDLDELTAPLLPSSAAALANRQRDLVARETRVLRAPESLTAEKQHGVVVVQRLPR